MCKETDPFERGKHAHGNDKDTKKPRGPAVNWALVAFLPLIAALVMFWLVLLVAEQFGRAWILSWIIQGVAVIAGIAFLAAGDRHDAVWSGGIVLAEMFARVAWTPRGLRHSLLPKDQRGE